MLEPMENIPEAYGGNHRLIYFKGRNSAYHSFYELLPPSVYFGQQPRVVQRDQGQAHHKDAQLCLTNEEMRRELTKNALALLREDPGADIIQISQNDTAGAARARNVLAVEEEEGGIRHRVRPAPSLRQPGCGGDRERVSGGLRRHVRLPVHAPGRRPSQAAPHVLIRLCDIECSFLQPLEGSAENAGFLRDLSDWSRIAGGNLFLWDYVTSFSSYMLPHPKLRVLAPNVRTFVKYGATGLFEQGDSLCAAGDFVRLRHWVLSHLLWNPGLDERQLTDTFLKGYYGEKTGAALKRYLDFLCDRAERSGIYLGCYQYNVSRGWTPKALRGLPADERRAGVRAGGGFSDPSGKKGLVDKVLREKLSLDHAPAAQRPASEALRAPADSRCLIRRSRSQLPRQDRGLRPLRREGVLRNHLRGDVRGLQEDAAGPGRHGDCSGCRARPLQGLPADAWSDWQEFEFNPRPAGQVSR
jgi:hypothetical protein